MQRLTKKKNEYDKYYEDIIRSLKIIEGFNERWLDDSFLERINKQLKTNIASLNGIKSEIEITDKMLNLNKELLEIGNKETHENEVTAHEESLKKSKNDKKNTEDTIKNKEKIIDNVKLMRKKLMRNYKIL